MFEKKIRQKLKLRKHIPRYVFLIFLKLCVKFNQTNKLLAMHLVSKLVEFQKWQSKVSNLMEWESQSYFGLLNITLNFNI